MCYVFNALERAQAGNYYVSQNRKYWVNHLPSCLIVNNEDGLCILYFFNWQIDFTTIASINTTPLCTVTKLTNVCNCRYVWKLT